jgi:hypothetical protein
MRRYYLDAELTSMLGPAYEGYESSDAYAEVSVIQAVFSETEHGNRAKKYADEFFLLMFSSIGILSNSVNLCFIVFC